MFISFSLSLSLLVEYKPDMVETNPHALLQQQIPESFKKLQDGINKLKREMPKMNEKEFHKEFGKFFEDDEELNEAVHYLTLQGM